MAAKWYVWRRVAAVSQGAGTPLVGPLQPGEWGDFLTLSGYVCERISGPHGSPKEASDKAADIGVRSGNWDEAATLVVAPYPLPD